ncbi:ATP-binding protein [Coleofasciculus sp. FACHB-129]|uniref:ATP-binding protein n=1 Tax=Cyanophyceae TaxID=3028117 RepID=UPI001685A421|nr:ATP-binding protein [Coleofasciculus sp. FACHB-129]MBD1897730.1 AAA family ATPase [Coleofasciculus sp. FACHB-129]
MATEQGFPPELLTQSAQKRLDYFKAPDKTVMHGNLKLAYHQVLRAIQEPAGASIILVMGPSGVGKTTLLRLVEKKIIEESLPQMELNPGWIPIVCVEAVAPGKDTFRWKDFYKRTLIAIDEPLIKEKISYSEDGIHRDSGGKLIVKSRATEDSLRLAMEQALSHRRPYTLAVDEFQDIGKMASQKVLEAHMDCIKSAVNTTKIPWTGFGTYQLIDFLELSPQLSRRTRIIHLPRYRLEDDEDIKEFKRVLKHLLCRMPLPETPPLVEKHWEYLYERSIGCIGTLKNWLLQALDLALEEGATTLTFSHLEQTAKLISECIQMAKDAIEGEEKLTDSKESQRQLHKLLNSKKQQAQKEQTGSGQDDQLQNNGGKSQPQRRRVGQRNPKRDPVASESL